MGEPKCRVCGRVVILQSVNDCEMEASLPGKSDRKIRVCTNSKCPSNTGQLTADQEV